MGVLLSGEGDFLDAVVALPEHVLHELYVLPGGVAFALHHEVEEFHLC